MWKAKAETPRRSSELAHRFLQPAPLRDLHLALVELPLTWFQPADGSERKCAASNAGLVTCLRSVLMKPEHQAWLDQIWERLTAAAAEVIG